MKKIVLLSLTCFLSAFFLHAQTPWSQFALALDSNTHVMQLNVALDSSGFILAAPGQSTGAGAGGPSLQTSTNAGPWNPMDITALDSSAVAVMTWHQYGPGNDIIVALDSAGNQSYYHHDVGGTLVALDSLGFSSFQVHNFLALDSLTFAAGMNTSNSHPTIITSVDSGATWTVMNPTFPLGLALDSGFSCLAGNGSTMAMLALDSITGLHLILTSTDNGASWNSGGFPGASFDVLGLALDSLGNMYAAGSNVAGAQIYKFPAGGSSWNGMDLTGIDLDSLITAIAVIDNRLVAAGIDSMGRSEVYYQSLPASITKAEIRIQAEIWPNPCQDKVSIRIPEAASGEWNLFLTDAQGRTIQTTITNGTALQRGEQFDLSGLPAGLYFITAMSGAVHTSARVVVNR